jgi:hypothetical protein
MASTIQKSHPLREETAAGDVETTVPGEYLWPAWVSGSTALVAIVVPQIDLRRMTWQNMAPK